MFVLHSGIECPSFSPVNGAVVVRTKQVVLAVVTCDVGFAFPDDTDTRTVICTTDGSWSVSPETLSCSCMYLRSSYYTTPSIH